MDTSSIGGASLAWAMPSAASRMPEAAEMQSAGPDNDRDTDDNRVGSVQSSSTSVNLSGQVLGRLINVSA